MNTGIAEREDFSSFHHGTGFVPAVRKPPTVIANVSAQKAAAAHLMDAIVNKTCLLAAVRRPAMTDITELAQLRSELSNPANGSKDHLRKLALLLVEALEKAQGMEAYWKTQCRGITDHCEELQARIAELESRTVKLPDDEDGRIRIRKMGKQKTPCDSWNHDNCILRRCGGLPLKCSRLPLASRWRLSDGTDTR